MEHPGARREAQASVADSAANLTHSPRDPAVVRDQMARAASVFGTPMAGSPLQSSRMELLGSAGFARPGLHAMFWTSRIAALRGDLGVSKDFLKSQTFTHL